METMEVENSITGGEEQSLGISSDLIRGHINTIILRSLYEEDKYGYDIIGEIEKKSGGLYTIKQPTLYSALKRLESLEYVESYYGEYSNGGRRKYFSLTEKGKAVTEKNLAEWEYSRTIIDSLISDGNAHYDFSFITDKQTELTELKRSLALREEALNEERTALSALKNELQRERALLSAQTASLSSQKTDVKEFKDKIEAQTRELEEKQTALFEKEGVIQAKETELLEKEQAIETAREEINAQNEKIRELTALLEAQKTELEDTKSQFTALQENKATEFYNRGLELRAQQAQMDAQKEKLEDEKRLLRDKEAELIQRETDLTALSTQIQSTEIEQSQLQAKLDELNEKEAQLTSLENALQTEKNELDKKRYELTQKEYEFEEKARLETALGTDKVREETEKLELIQKDLETRQALYNQQQLEFITKKNALSAELFAFNDKVAEFDKKTALFEQEKATLEEEKFALAQEKNALEEKAEFLETQKQVLEEEKKNFERSKTEAERVLQESGQKATSESANLQKQLSELQERELSLAQRETMLNNAIRDFRNQQAIAYQQNEATYQAIQNQRFTPAYAQHNEPGDFSDLQRQAQTDGIRLRTAGEQKYATTPTQTASANGYFNMGLSLFKSAFIIFCIVAFEALFAYFIRGYLGVSVLYPLLAFAGGFVTFITFAILYAQGYKAKARKKKHSSYLLTSSVIFVIAVIVTTMIAVYFKAETSNPAQLLSFVVLPILYLFNIVLFAIFYRLFSARSKVTEK